MGLVLLIGGTVLIATLGTGLIYDHLAGRHRDAQGGDDEPHADDYGPAGAHEPRNLGAQHLSLEELETWPEHKLCSHL